MSDTRGPYRVYHLNRHVNTFTSLDEASEWKWQQATPEDYEILDRSDES